MTMNVTKRMGGFAVAVVGGLVLAGAATTAFRTQAEEPPQGSSKYPTVTEYLALVAETTPPEQAAVMSDGVVTLEEYEGAIQRYYACVSEFGIIPDPEPAKGLRPSTFGLIIPDADGVPDKETVSYYSAKIGDCRFAHVEDISVAWAGQQATMDPTTVAESLKLVEGCLADAGVDAEFPSVTAVSDRLMSAKDSSAGDTAFLLTYLRTCRLWVEEQTGYSLP